MDCNYRSLSANKRLHCGGGFQVAIFQPLLESGKNQSSPGTLKRLNVSNFFKSPLSNSNAHKDNSHYDHRSNRSIFLSWSPSHQMRLSVVFSNPNRSSRGEERHVAVLSTWKIKFTRHTYTICNEF